MSGPFSCNYAKNGSMVPDIRTPSELHRIFYQRYKDRKMSRRHPSRPIDSRTFLGTLDELEGLQQAIALEEYYTLLDSYTLDKWNQMPWPLSPIVCALKGWECSSSPGIVRCSVCRKTCSFDLFSYSEIFHGLSKTDQAMRAWLVEQFITRLVEPGHDEKCLRRPLARASLVNQFANFTMKSFRGFFNQRLKSLLPLLEKLPVVVAEYDEVLTPRDALSCISKLEEKCAPTVATNTVAIALHGWEHVITDEDVKCLHCRECRRKVDYSKFCTIDRLAVLQQNESSNFHPDLFSWPKAEGFRFDCRNEHLSWCPWIRPVVVSEEMGVVLSLKPSEKVVGCDVTLAAFSVDLQSVEERRGEIATNFDQEADSLRRNIAAARKEMSDLQKKFQQTPSG